MIEKTEQMDIGKLHYLLIILLRMVHYSKRLYTICTVILWGTWYLLGACAYVFLCSTGCAEWIRTGVALAVVVSSLALIYIFLVIIPAYLWEAKRQ